MCADLMKAHGDIVVTPCRRDSKLRFFKTTDLTFVTEIDIAFEGRWLQLGVNGFELIQNGGTYTVLFTAYQTGPIIDCGNDPSSNSDEEEVCVDEFGSKYVLNLVDFLFDKNMTGSQSYRAYLHNEVAESYIPFELGTALDGAYATWLVQDAVELQV